MTTKAKVPAETILVASVDVVCHDLANNPLQHRILLFSDGTLLTPDHNLDDPELDSVDVRDALNDKPSRSGCRWWQAAANFISSERNGNFCFWSRDVLVQSRDSDSRGVVQPKFWTAALASSWTPESLKLAWTALGIDDEPSSMPPAPKLMSPDELIRFLAVPDFALTGNPHLHSLSAFIDPGTSITGEPAEPLSPALVSVWVATGVPSHQVVGFHRLGLDPETAAQIIDAFCSRKPPLEPRDNSLSFTEKALQLGVKPERLPKFFRRYFDTGGVYWRNELAASVISRLDEEFSRDLIVEAILAIPSRQALAQFCIDHGVADEDCRVWLEDIPAEIEALFREYGPLNESWPEMWNWPTQYCAPGHSHGGVL